MTKQILFAIVLFSSLASFAQTAIDQRKDNQQQRIENGVQNGQLTKGEDRRLERQQGRIDRRENRMEADGNLSNSEKRRLTRQQNRADRRIFRDKHNARVGK